MTLKEIANWILTLPEDIQAEEMCSVVHGRPFTAKRVVAFRYKDGSGKGAYVESMGTHLTDGSSMDIVGHISA